MQIRNQRGAGAFETILACILVSILIVAVIPYYQKVAQGAKEMVLRTGLNQIRKGVELYALLQGHFPEDLKSLVHARYVVPMRDDTFFSGEYLRAQAVDTEGYPVDPFGVRYRYDPKEGKLASGSRGYESW